VTAGPDGLPRFTPVPELQSLRGGLRRVDALDLGPSACVAIEAATGECVEIEAEFETGRPRGGEFGLVLRRSPDGAQQTALCYDVVAQTLTLDLDRSGQVTTGRFAAPVPLPADGVLRLHVFVDRSSVEAFAGDGCAVLSARIFPGPQSTGAAAFARGTAVRLRRLDAWPLTPANARAQADGRGTTNTT